VKRLLEYIDGMRALDRALDPFAVEMPPEVFVAAEFGNHTLDSIRYTAKLFSHHLAKEHKIPTTSKKTIQNIKDDMLVKTRDAINGNVLRDIKRSWDIESV
jgi:hypothetical protein